MHTHAHTHTYAYTGIKSRILKFATCVQVDSKYVLQVLVYVGPTSRVIYLPTTIRNVRPSLRYGPTVAIINYLAAFCLCSQTENFLKLYFCTGKLALLVISDILQLFCFQVYRSDSCLCALLNFMTSH